MEINQHDQYRLQFNVEVSSGAKYYLSVNWSYGTYSDNYNARESKSATAEVALMSLNKDSQGEGVDEFRTGSPWAYLPTAIWMAVALQLRDILEQEAVQIEEGTRPPITCWQTHCDKLFETLDEYINKELGYV